MCLSDKTPGPSQGPLSNIGVAPPLSLDCGRKQEYCSNMRHRERAQRAHANHRTAFQKTTTIIYNLKLRLD